MAVTLVTGCSTGIGFATAVRFAQGGDRVFATVLEPADGDELRAFADAEALPVTIMAVDVTDDESVARGVSGVLDAAGRIDVLVNNAGRAVIAPVEETDLDEARAVFEPNFFGVLRMLRATLPGMRRQRSGTIVNVSSLSGVSPAPFYGVYAATKAAVEALSDSLYYELRSFGVRVVVVEPGNIKTSILSHAVVARGFGGDSPYRAAFEAQRAGARPLLGKLIGPEMMSPPELVADTIYTAVHDGSGRIRYPAGPDAEELSALVANVGRQQFLDLLLDVGVAAVAD